MNYPQSACTTRAITINFYGVGLEFTLYISNQQRKDITQ